MPRLLACSLLGLLAVLCSSPSSAKQPKEVKGVVQEVDATVGTITLLVGEGPKTLQVKTYSLARPDLPVTDAVGKPIPLSGLQTDQRVYLTIAANDDVRAIRQAPPTLFGLLTQVHVPERTVVLKTSIGDKTVPIPADAKILSQNQPVPLADLKPGLPALVLYSPDKKTVLELRTGKGVLPLTRLSKGIGVLIDLDRDRRTVEVLVTAHEGDHYLLRRLTFGSEPSLELLYQSRPFRELPLDELVRGVKVAFWTDVVTKKIAHLDVDMPILGKRVVKTVDAAQARLVLEDAEGDKVLQLSSRLKVRTPTGIGKLEDIRAGVLVNCGLSPNRREVELLQITAK